MRAFFVALWAGALLAGPAPIAPASPFSPASLDPQIQACLAEISADSLESYITALQGFQTRHTNSDTVSTTAGAGAARRWVHGKFEEFAAQGGNITASYFDFETTILGVAGFHRNVVGEIPGTAPAAERRIYVMGGHLDSRNEDAADILGPAPGADDDASGIACLLECARVMSTKSWPMTFRFVAFTGEEQGLFGAEFYSLHAALNQEPIAAMLNNDTMASIIGAPHPDSTVMSDTTMARVFASEPPEGPHRQFQRYLKAMGDAYVPAQNIVVIPAEDRPSRGGDHQAFVAQGFTAIRYMEYLEEVARQHTALGDTLGPHLDMNYLRRNAQVDLATLANLGLSPASPEGLTVGNIGDATGFEITWPASNPEPDLDGYFLTMRLPGELDYSTVLDLGTVNSHTIPVAPADSIFFGLSVRNSGGHRALVSHEVLGVLSTVPFPPTGLVASSRNAAIQLDWTPSPEVDLAGYHVYRSTTSGGGFAPLTGAPIASPTYVDATALPHQYYYYAVTAVDADANESGLSAEDVGRLVTLDLGPLFVDETKNGTSAWFPTEAGADSVYANMTAGLGVTMWDFDSDGVPTLADLAPYSAVLWVSDDFNQSFQGYPVTQSFLSEAEDALASYLDLGGGVLIAGWQNVRGANVPREYEIDLVPGDFLYDYFGLDAVGYKQQASLTEATGEGSFPSAALEPTRLRSNWGGKQIRIEYATQLRPGAEVAYRFASDDPDSAYHERPIGVTMTEPVIDGSAMIVTFPIYHLTTPTGNALLAEALSFLAGTTVDAPTLTPRPHWSLAAARPNPFVDATEIRFVVPGAAAEVDVAVYNLAGRRVRELLRGRVDGGPHVVTWDGRNDDGRRVAAGVYFYRLQSDAQELTRKVVRLR